MPWTIGNLLLVVGLFLARCDGRAMAQSYLFESSVKKIALVVGNGDYETQQKLPGTLADVDNVANALTTLGFAVTSAKNFRTRTEFSEDVLKPFLKQIEPGSLVVFYYSGHGISYGGESYLLPLHFTVPVPAADVEDTFVSVTQIRNRIDDYKPAFLIMMLDACRDVPSIVKQGGVAGKFQTKGLTPPSGEDTLIWFSSESGKVSLMPDPAEPSIYTAALVKRLPAKGDSIEQVKKQVRIDVRKATNNKQSPWSSESYSSELWLNPELQTLEAIRSSWRSALESKDPEVIRTYLLRYGTSQYAAAARKWLSDNPNAVASTSPVLPGTVERLFEDPGRDPHVNSGSTGRLLDIESLRTDKALAATRREHATPGGSLGTIVIKTPVEANVSKDKFSPSVRLAPGSQVASVAIQDAPLGGRGPASVGAKKWLEIRNPAGGGTLFIPLDLSDGPQTIDIGRATLEVTAPPPPETGPLAAVDAAFVAQAIADVRSRGRIVSWVSISTPPTTSRRERDLFLLRAQAAVHLLDQGGVPRNIVTVSEGSALGQDNIRLRFFGK